MKVKIGKVLIADDDKNVLRSLEIYLEPYFEKVKTINNPNNILHELQAENYNVVLLDMNFKAGQVTGNEGIFWLRELKKRGIESSVVMFTAYGDLDLAVETIKEGAIDFILKPWNNEKLLTTLQNAIQLHISKNRIKVLEERTDSLNQVINQSESEIIGRSSIMNNLLKTIDKVAATDANILLLGENGSGKELIARRIHNLSSRLNKPLITVDLGSLNENLFESELFGHTKGAFTGANIEKQGRFQIACGGTLFLDEIGNIPILLQSKLLSSLQNRTIYPVGSTKSIDIDVRLISATNRNIPKLISEGLFREDLYYRINTIQLEIPPLRERGEDIILIAQHYLKIYSNKYEKLGLKLSEEAINGMLNYSWPGNIRELRHSIEKAVILSEKSILLDKDFAFNKTAYNENKEVWPLKFEEIERKAIIRALENNKGRIGDAAEELGLTRQTLRNKMIKYQIVK
jgi:DNA-binding NtrC family response regulator